MLRLSLRILRTFITKVKSSEIYRRHSWVAGADFELVKGDEVKTTTDLNTNRPHNRKVEAGVGISVGTHDSLISHRGFKSEEIDDFRPFHLVKSPADEHSSLASRVPILLAGVENRHRVPDITVKQTRQKKVRVEVPLEIRRWSKRIAGPAKEFNRFFRRLPLELQKAI